MANSHVACPCARQIYWCILLMHRKFTGYMAVHFTDAQKIYWMHGYPSSHILRVHALHGANSWSVKKYPCFLANQIAGILRTILLYLIKNACRYMLIIVSRHSFYFIEFEPTLEFLMNKFLMNLVLNSYLIFVFCFLGGRALNLTHSFNKCSTVYFSHQFYLILWEITTTIHLISVCTDVSGCFFRFKHECMVLLDYSITRIIDETDLLFNFVYK